MQYLHEEILSADKNFSEGQRWTAVSAETAIAQSLLFFQQCMLS
jgi:hypothetical protein